MLSPEVPASPGDKTAPFDLGSWKQKLAHFGNNAESRSGFAGQASTQERSSSGSGQTLDTDIEQLRFEWHLFLEHLVKKNQQVMVSHLHSCELTACNARGVLELTCCRKFSYEELLHDASLLEKEIGDFYQLPLKLQVRYDADKDACTREKTIFTLFQELSQTNEVVRYLIREFGGELVY
jgi:DNA polymerase-3 subunit gamma/tau